MIDSSLPPVEPEEPILIPEVPEFLEAVDPLKESEVPDLEDTGELLDDKCKLFLLIVYLTNMTYGQEPC